MQNSPMKFVIIGTINKDLILPFQGSPIQGFGGIYFTISALSHLGGSQLNITPVSFVGQDTFPNLKALINGYQNINQEGLIELNQKHHEVILEYFSPEERSEKALFKFPSLEWKNMKNLLDADFIIVNMITGWDLSLKAFLKLSKKFYEKMYLDVHFLVMGTDKLGNRYPEAPDDIGYWLRGAKFVQMNEREFTTLNFSALHESDFFEQNFNPDQILIITLANKGARLLYQKNGMIRNKSFPAHKLNQVIDCTGSGDVFGASFAWKYMNTKKLNEAVEYANKAAAANCTLRGTSEMDLLISRMEQFKLVTEK